MKSPTQTYLMTLFALLVNIPCYGQSDPLAAIFEKAYFLETSRGDMKQAASMYQQVSQRADSPTLKKKALQRLISIPGIAEKQQSIYQQQLIVDHQVSLQQLVDALPEKSTLWLPAGVYTKALQLKKSIRIQGADDGQSIFECTIDQPVIEISEHKGPVELRSLVIKSQLATSTPEKIGCAVYVKDGNVRMSGCEIHALGGTKQSPAGIFIDGFSIFAMTDCHTEGYDFTVQVTGGAEGNIDTCLIERAGHCGVTAASSSTVTINRSVIVRCTGGTLNLQNSIVLHNGGTHTPLITMGPNVFWENKADTESIDLPKGMQLNNPRLTLNDEMDFTLGSAALMKARQGLADPKTITKLRNF